MSGRNAAGGQHLKSLLHGSFGNIAAAGEGRSSDSKHISFDESCKKDDGDEVSTAILNDPKMF